MSEYSVEQIDEDAMTEFIQAKTCRRQVLSRYFDGSIEKVDCHNTDSVFCDWCKTMTKATRIAARRVEHAAGSIEEEEREGIEAESKRKKEGGAEIIAKRLRALQESHESMIRVMDRLQGRCIYCELMKGEEGQLHGYSDCIDAEADGCGYNAYKQWREEVDLGQYQHCWKCGMSQDVCRRLEDDGWCEYPDIMLPGMFILHQQSHLATIVETVGFQGEYRIDVWEWLNEIAEGFGGKWESNWMKTWRGICVIYQSMVDI